jgi:lipid-A-disaccharide synthase
MTAEAPRIFIVAAEPSGDALAGDLIDALRALNPQVQVAGVGGDQMLRRNVVSPFDISELSVFGIFDGLKIINLVHERAGQTAAAARDFGADAVILIDSWGFMLRASWQLEDQLPDVPRIKYVAPQVFAARRGRAKVAAKNFTHLLAIHPFDAPYFEPHGLPVHFVGNPVMERDLSGDGPSLRAALGIGTDAPVLLVLFGSRRSELARLFEPFTEAVRQLRRQRPDLEIITTLSPSIAQTARAQMAGHDAFDGVHIVDSDARADAFAAADVALACSGTVTVELSRAGVPTIAAYRLGWGYYVLARLFLMKAKYISLTNHVVDEELIPEFIQHQCTGPRLAAAVTEFLDNETLRAERSLRLKAAADVMAGEAASPSRAAAEAVLAIAREARQKKTGAA